MLSTKILRYFGIRSSGFLLALMLLLLPGAGAHAAPDDDSFYSPSFGLGILEGTNSFAGFASVVAVDSEYVYFGGVFAKVGGYRVNNIVRYHKRTSRFERLGGLNACGTNGEVLVIKIVKGGVHVGGKFSKVGVDSAQAGGTETGPYAYYDNKDWKPAGPKIGFANGGPGAMVSAIEFDGSDTYVAGVFNLVGKDTIRNVARYKGGDTMEPLWEQGHLTNGVTTTKPTLTIAGLKVTQSSVIVGGNITIAGGSIVNGVAKWNKNLETWDGMKGGPDQASSGGVSFMDQDHLGKVLCANKHVHRWDDTGWTILPGTETMTSVNRFLWNTPFGSMAYGSGAPAFDSGSIAFWDGTVWKGPNVFKMGFTANFPLSFAADDKRIWIGSGNGGLSGANGMAFYDGKQFGALGNGLRVTRPGGLGFNDFIEFDGQIIAAGSFSHLGSTAVEGIARWTGTAWEAMGEGYSSVWRLAVFKGKLYAAGSFQKKGGEVLGGLARWTGTAWEIVPGFEKIGLEAVAATEDYLYMAGGGIGPTAAPLGRWDGTTLEGFGKELTSAAQIGINSIVPRQSGNICVSGYFNKVNGVATGGVACYDGTSKIWTPMGAALPSGSNATSLAAIGNDLYLGIYGTFPGGAKNIGKWDGKDWVAVGAGLDKGVQRLVANGTDLYAVGAFTTAGTLAVNGVARWDGKDWTALGSGVSPANVVSAYVGTSGLWLGGQFTLAGGIASRNVALYTNVEKKASIPMALLPRGQKPTIKASPRMLLRLPTVIFGSEADYHHADGRTVPAM